MSRVNKTGRRLPLFQYSRQDGAEAEIALQALQLVSEKRVSRAGYTDQRGWTRRIVETGVRVSGQHGPSPRWKRGTLPVSRHRWQPSKYWLCVIHATSFRIFEYTAMK